MCKQHFCQQVKAVLRKELRNIFRAPERAYASMDFYGRGYITEEDFLNSIVLQRIPYSREDVREFFRQFNLFALKQNQGTGSLNSTSHSVERATPQKQGQAQQTEPGMTFDHFKKTFFPQLYLINEENESDEERKMKQKQLELSAPKGKDKG